MKRVSLFIVALLFSVSSYAQGIMQMIDRSEDFFYLLDKGQYEDAQNYFDPAVKDKVTIGALKSLWANMVVQLGVFQEVDGVQSGKSGEYFVVTLNCKFAHNTQPFRMVYNAAEKVIAFNILPKNTTAPYAPAAYADTTLYSERYVTVKTEKHQLAGLLTLPKKGTNFPVVILVHGSGPSDMDETIGPNKPFKDLAAGLAAKGIATIRYVKRTMIYTAEFGGAYTVKEEVIDDALSAIALARTVPEVDKKQIYLLGHSLGGMLAPRIAALAPDLNGMILAAAPARKMTDLMVEQNINYFSSLKDTTKAGKTNLDNALKMLEASRIVKLGTLKPDSTIIGVPASYWIDLNLYDQVAAAKKFKNKLLILQGENDIQVSDADLKIWKDALASRKNVTFKTYPQLDHLLSPQTEKDYTGGYKKQVNVADYLINDIAAWIKTP